VIVLRLVPIGKDLMGARQVILQASASLDVVDGSLRRLTGARETSGGKAGLGKLKTGIRLEDVAFSYPDGREALTRMDLLIGAGQMTALVGPSGGGKSTLVDLLPRLRRPGKGRILFDDVPIDEIALVGLRSGIAFVPQQAQLFDGTIADHIAYSRPDASLGEIEHAARLAHAHDFIATLPEGYATRIGEGGGRLSGGQRQRLDLARALIQKAPVLILDEPTSALDSESEQVLRVALDDVRRHLAPTMIVIAHRLSTVVGADRIVVMDQGRVLEAGTHAELVTRNGWYARAWATQTAQAA
jgi:ABC-type multidrug transport system fused ATPase/permease subunit